MMFVYELLVGKCEPYLEVDCGLNYDRQVRMYNYAIYLCTIIIYFEINIYLGMSP